MQEEVLQSESVENESVSESQSNSEAAANEQSVSTNQNPANAEIIEPEAIEGDFVVAKPEIVYH